MTSGNTDRRAELARAERRLAAHPGFKQHVACEALARSLMEVFQPNLNELMRLLDAAAGDLFLAIELVQHVHTDSVRRRFIAATTQRFHNYLASTMSLVEHARRLMRGRTGAVATEFRRRKTELLNHAEVPFMMDLRVYTQHRALALLAHSLSISNVNTPDRKFESEVELSVADLSEWDGWSSASRGFLRAQGEVVVLRPVIREHGELVYALNLWLHEALSEENAQALEFSSAESRADIVIQYGATTVVVENKVDATEQPNQLQRLASDHPQAHWVFLTPTARVPMTAGDTLADWHLMCWADVAQIVSQTCAEHPPSGPAAGVVTDYLLTLRRQFR